MLFDLLPLNQFLSYFSEQVVNVVAILRWNLHVRIAMLFSIFLNIFFRHLPLSYVRFVAYHENRSVRSSRFPNKIQPTIQIIKWCSQTQIQNYHTCVCIFDIWWDKCSKSFLPGCIPQLQSKCLSFNLHSFCDKVNTDRWLSKYPNTFAVNSKESWIKRDMIEVFPTFWSPTNTTLNLLSLGI